MWWYLLDFVAGMMVGGTIGALTVAIIIGGAVNEKKPPTL